MMKILVGTLTHGKNSGGIDNYLFQVLEDIKQRDADLQLDFLIQHESEQVLRELQPYQSNLIKIPSMKHPLAHYRAIRQVLQQEVYDAVYFNVSTAINCIGCIAAKHIGIQTRIVHAHSNGIDAVSTVNRTIRKMLNQLCIPVMYKSATHFWSNSDESAIWVFGQKVLTQESYRIIPLPIDMNMFQNQPDVSNTLRKEWNLEGQLVLGHIGRFSYQKNHRFLIDTFREVRLQVPKSKLILVGDGELFNETKAYISQLHLEQDVFLLGQRSDTAQLLQLFDYFVLPSRFEGAGIVVLEAEACGVPCIVSDVIPKVVNLSGRVKYLPIASKEDSIVWANYIVKQWKNLGRVRIDTTNEFMKLGYAKGSFDYAKLIRDTKN